MKDLGKLAAQCEAELEGMGLTCGTVRRWSVNSRAEKRWGQCRQVAEGVFDIEISQRLLEDEVDEIATKTTIIHELLHTVEGCLGHRGKWKFLAEMVGKTYPQYQIKRTSSCEEKGLSQAGETQARYRITCTGCGVQAYRQRAGRLVKRPEDFRCGKCGGKLVAERLQNRI
ncbi:MAG: hypothetical protein HFI67_08765 [Lachnospiraceae bacterium]|jgi:predicted SprT family Zn-dependent metalloprotease|nr:hypothetical protein [Lachnospiraceae bacterium]